MYSLFVVCNFIVSWNKFGWMQKCACTCLCMREWELQSPWLPFDLLSFHSFSVIVSVWHSYPSVRQRFYLPLNCDDLLLFSLWTFLRWKIAVYVATIFFLSSVLLSLALLLASNQSLFVVGFSSNLAAVCWRNALSHSLSFSLFYSSPQRQAGPFTNVG